LYRTITKIIFWNLFTCKGTYMIDWVGRLCSHLMTKSLDGWWPSHLLTWSLGHQMTAQTAELTFENICNLKLFILMHEHRKICLEILSGQIATGNEWLDSVNSCLQGWLLRISAAWSCLSWCMSIAKYFSKF